MLRIKNRLFFHFTHFPAGKGWFLVFLITLAVYCWSISCTGDNACKQSRDVFLMVSFRSTVHNTEHDTTLSYLTVYGLRRSDSLLYDSAQVNKVSLPLNPSTDSTGFVFACHDAVDTLMVVYNRQPHLLSYECGFVMYYRLIQVTIRGNLADSLHIIQSDVTTDNGTNIHMYY